MTIINIFVMGLSYPVYLHFLGYERYGVWLVLAVVLGFAQLGNLGVGSALIKLVSQEFDLKNHDKVRAYVISSLFILSVSSLLAFLLIVLFKNQIVNSFNLNDNNSLLANSLLPYIGILSVYVIFTQAVNSILSGFGRMDIANYLQCFGRIITILVSFTLLVIGFDIISLIVANLFCYVFIHIVSIVYIKRIFGQGLFSFKDFNFIYCREVLKVGFALWGSSSIGLLIHPFNKIMISRYVGVSSLPVYEIALRGSEQLRSLFASPFRALMPEISRHAGNLSKDGCQAISRINRKALVLIVVWAGALYLGLFVLADPLLKIWLGSKFQTEIVDSFRTLQFGSYFSLLGVPAYYGVIGMGRPRYALMSSMIQSAGNFLIVVILILVAPSLSVVSVCLASVIGMLLSTLFLLAKRKAEFSRLARMCREDTC